MTLFAINKKTDPNNEIDSAIKNCKIAKIIQFNANSGTYMLNFEEVDNCADIDKRYGTQNQVKNKQKKKVYGLTRQLKEVFYPSFEQEKNLTKMEKRYKSSSINEGKKTHGEIFQYFKNDNIKLNDLGGKAQAVLNYFKDFNEIPYIFEFPCVGGKCTYATQADIICTKNGKVRLYELKTGYLNKDYNEYNEKMKGSMKEIRNSPINHAYLQLLYTFIALKQTIDLEITDTRVLCVYERTEDKKNIVECIENPKWYKKIMKKLRNNKLNINDLIDQLK